MTSQGKDGKRLLCHCLTVTWQEVEETVRSHGCRNVHQVTERCGAGGGCRSCHVEIEQVIAKVRSERRSVLARFFGGLLRREDEE